MATSKQAYDAYRKLWNYVAVGRKLGISKQKACDLVHEYCHKFDLPRPVKPQNGPTGEAVYQAVLKQGSILGAARSLKYDRLKCAERLRKYCDENDLDVPAGSGPNHPKGTVAIEYPNQQQLKIEGVRRYIVTSMHNNTPMNVNAFKALEAAAVHMGAQLVVIPLLYKNPSLFTSAQAKTVEWPKEALPYTIYDNVIINDEWMIAGKLHIQATAARPLEGMQGFSKERSCVIGHARLAWETRPTPPGRPAIRQITTGSISIPQYSDTKLGQLSDFHHTLGALLIETDDTSTFVRHLRPNTATGQFYDFEHMFGPGGYEGADPNGVDTVVWGDLHEIFSTEKALILEFSRRHKPLHSVIHDAIDSFAISHHHEGDPLMRIAKKTLHLDSLEIEMGSMAAFHTELRASLAEYSQVIYVESNHNHDHIMRWMRARNWQLIDGNSKLHRFLLNAYGEHLEKPENAAAYAREGTLPSPFHLLMIRGGADLHATIFPSINESVLVGGIEVAQHGHRGPNGSKGTPGAFRKSQYKMIIGHIHSPGMYDGVYVVGTSGGLKMNYNDGLSGWDTVHATIDRLGKRRLFNTVAGRYRLEVNTDGSKGTQKTTQTARRAPKGKPARQRKA